MWGDDEGGPPRFVVRPAKCIPRLSGRLSVERSVHHATSVSGRKRMRRGSRWYAIAPVEGTLPALSNTPNKNVENCGFGGVSKALDDMQSL